MYMNKLVSADGDAAWIERFSSYKSKDHRFVCIYGGVEGWLEFIEREPKSLLDHSTVLVDCAPGEARVPIIKALKKYEPRFIIAHDTDRPESASAYGWHELDGLYKYETTMKRLLPWTTVYSDVEKFQLEECDS